MHRSAFYARTLRPQTPGAPSQGEAVQQVGRKQILPVLRAFIARRRFKLCAVMRNEKI